jgi:hypothetical protein
LQRLLEAAEHGARTGNVITILVLQALAHQAQGELAAALAPLERAVALAEPEGYVRTFVDEGPAMGGPTERGHRQGEAVITYLEDLGELDFAIDTYLGVQEETEPSSRSVTRRPASDSPALITSERTCRRTDHDHHTVHRCVVGSLARLDDGRSGGGVQNARSTANARRAVGVVSCRRQVEPVSACLSHWAVASQ